MFMMSFQQNISFGGCNPFMFGAFNPRLNFFLGLAGATAGVPYYPVMSMCGCSIFNPYMAASYSNPYAMGGFGSFNYQPQTFTYIPQTTTNPFASLITQGQTTNPFAPVSTAQFASSASSSTTGDRARQTIPVGSTIEYNSKELSEIRNSKILSRVPQDRKNEILSAVDEACKKYNVDPKLVISMMYCESGFNPNATSRCGAAGLMQLMPATAKSYGASNPYNIKENIFAAVKFIKYLKERYNGNRDLIIAAYNAGPGRVKSQVPNIKETKNYVAKVNQIYSSLS